MQVPHGRRELKRIRRLKHVRAREVAAKLKQTAGPPFIRAA